ncbi:MAG: hypothetical protein M1120_03575 [Patescibacteria group bacterium]|nr:hypothetical protein [Patescibacteria group bacterium]
MDKVYQTLKLFPQQCDQAWEESTKVQFPAFYSTSENLVVSAMGASCFGYYVLKTLYGSILKIPLVLANSYHLPGFVEEKTLLIAQSYSGTTEETINCLEQGYKLKALVSGVSTGGQLSEILKSNNTPHYLINPINNPSGQPRYGTGYTIFGLLGFLNKLGFLTLNSQEVERATGFVSNSTNNIENSAKKFFTVLQNKQIVIVSGQHLAGNAHILRNQFNESSKSFSDYYLLPELNHHLLEGLQNPVTNKKNLVFVGLQSKFYSDKIKKRLELTKEIVEKNDIEFKSIDILGNNTLEEVLWTISFGGFLSYFLAQYYKVDPIAIPWVNYFKKKLKT